MSSKFTVCFLTQGRESAPEFLVSDVNLRPSLHDPFFTLPDVLLASGFTSIVPETVFPLSPSLQLNHDLSRLEEGRLCQLAHAELARIQSTVYRSYVIEPDPRLCVIGSNAAKLQEFVETYGGMLEISPLLVGSYDLAFPGISELTVEQRGGGLILEYSQRTPIDNASCSYCGGCGPACPEGCLDEQLFLDFKSCTFCTACEKVCPHGAIDVHREEYCSLDTPALLVLDGTEVELPEVRTNIYVEKEMVAYLAGQCGLQVDEAIICDPAFCQYNAKHGIGCRSCLDSCPHGAVSRGPKGMVVDSVQCTECGGCVAACPTGAMQHARFADSNFISFVKSLQPGGATVVLGSEKALHRLWWKRPEPPAETLFVEYPQIGGLSLFHLLYLLAAGAVRIILLTEDEAWQGNVPLSRNMALAGSLLNTWFGFRDRILVQSASGFMIMEDKAVEPVPEPFVGQLIGNRRENLATLLNHLALSSDRQARIKANDALPFATIGCDDERCTQCFACLNVCRMQALSTSEDGLSLRSRPVLCVGCGACVQVCPERALTMMRGATLDNAYFNHLVLAETEGMICRRCGKVFGSRKSYERVMSILAAKETVNTDHFAYCETCRVVNLFENV